MKKTIALISLLVLMLWLVGCNKNGQYQLSI